MQISNHSAVYITSAQAGPQGGGGLFAQQAKVLVAGWSRIVISDSRSQGHGGGFYVSSLRALDHAVVSIHASSAQQRGGGFFACLCNVTLEDPQAVVVANSSRLTISSSEAQTGGGGFAARGPILVTAKSEVMVFDGQTWGGDGGGFLSRDMKVADDSQVRLASCSAGGHGGGFAAVDGSVNVVNTSLLRIESARADMGGGFWTSSIVAVTGQSRLLIAEGLATYGGGFYAKKLSALDAAEVRIERSSAKGEGGGFWVNPVSSQGAVRPESLAVAIAGGSMLRIQDASAGQMGGFAAMGRMVVAGLSTVVISNSRAVAGYAGGFAALDTLELTDGSVLRIRNVSARGAGGAFRVDGKFLRLVNHSIIDIGNSTSADGGGFFVARGKVQVYGRSRIMISDGHAAGVGGGFVAFQLLMSDHSTVSLQTSSARTGGGGFILEGNGTGPDADLLIANSSLLSLQATGLLLRKCYHVMVIQ